MKKLFFLLIIFVATGCHNPYVPPPTYEETVLKIMEDCNEELESGRHASLSAMLADCQKEKTIAAFIFHKDGRDVDLITEMLDHEIKVAKDVEAGKITLEQASQRLEKFSDRQVKKSLARQEKRKAESQRELDRLRKKREAEEKRLTDYYKNHPHEYQLFLQQQRQLELLEQQTRMIAEQQAQAARAEETRKFREALGSFADSITRNAYRYQAPVHCTTSYQDYSGISSTTCY